MTHSFPTRRSSDLPVDASKFNDDSAVNGAGAIAYTTGKVTVVDFQAASATITGALSGSAATFTSSVTANSFVGNGAALTDLNASNVNSGLLGRSEEHTSELQSLMRISYAVFCLKKKK